MLKKPTTFFLVVLIICSLTFAYSPRNVNATATKNYPDQTLTPPGVWTVVSTHYSDVWDLTKGDLTLSYTIDMTHVAQPAAWATSYTEVGLRTEGASDFNPGPFGVYQGGCGGWMASLYGDLTPSPNTLSLFEKHNLGASGGQGEGDYDCLLPVSTGNTTKFGSSSNYGIWFDRDGVDPWQDDDPNTPSPGGSAVPWGSHNGQTYNTGGIYQIVIQYHAITANLGSMFATVNGIPTGFYLGGYHGGEPDYYPAGLSFKGDMARMQIFEGIIAPGSSAQYGYTVVHNLIVTGELGVSSPLVADFTYSPTLVEVGTPVQFTDASYGGYLPHSAWSWDLNGDGVVDSSAQNPSYVYTKPGDYNVKLTVTGYCPYCGSATITKAIHVSYSPVLWVDGNKTLYGPCLKSTTFPIDVRLYNDPVYTNTDVYAFDFNLTWSAAPITLTSVVVNSPWATGEYLLIDNSTYDSNYHLAMTAMPPGEGLTIALNISLVTLTFHIDQDFVWPLTVTIPFTLTNNGMSGDGTQVIQLLPEVDNGLVILQSVQPDIHLQSPDMLFDNSTKLYYVTERASGVTHTIEVHLSNATDVFGFYVDLKWSSTYKNSTIQKITIDPNFPPPYEYIDTAVTPGEAKITLVRPCEKIPVCGVDVTAFSIVLTVLPADAGKIPTPVNTTISIASAFVLSKDANGIVWEYDYLHTGPFTADPYMTVSNYGYGLEYSCDLINFWNPKRPDINLDGVVNIGDLSALAKQYGNAVPWGALSATVGDPTTVDIFDFVYIAKNFGDP